MTRTSEDKGENVKTSPKIENSSFELRSSFLSFDPFFDENFILKQLKNYWRFPTHFQWFRKFTRNQRSVPITKLSSYDAYIGR